MYSKITLVCLIMACFFSCKKDAAPKEVSEFEEFVTELQSKGFTTGNILVYKNGEVIFKNSNGLRSIDLADSLSLGSQFRLASVSKQFTAMAIMKLKEAGKLDYDQKVNTIIQDFPYDNITIKHLLHHVSGLEGYENLVEKNWLYTDSTKGKILGNDAIIKDFHAKNPPLRFEPGERWEYSNTGYLYLASIVEKVSGQHFRDYVKQTIFDPLGMKNTLLYKYQIVEDSQMPNRVYGYEIGLDQIQKKPNDYNVYNDVRGDGGLYSTLEDLYIWNQALVSNKIIPQSYLDEAWSSGILNNGEKTNYGFGWGINTKDNGGKIVSHSGGWVGFVTYLHNDTDTNSGFVILTNNSGDGFGEIYRGLSSIFNGNGYELPKRALMKDMAKAVMTENLDTALELYHSKKLDTVNYGINEGQINALGYQLLGEDKIDDALGIFQLNIDEHPKSANTYDSFGDALLVKGDSIKALENFKKCFAMDSTLTYAKDKFVALEQALNSN